MQKYSKEKKKTITQTSHYQKKRRRNWKIFAKQMTQSKRNQIKEVT